MGLPALIAVVLLGKDAANAVRVANETSYQREAVSIEHGLELLGGLHASEQMSQTMLDEAFHNVVLAKKPSWIKENFGKSAATPGERLFVIVDPDGKAVFSSDFEAVPPQEHADKILAAAAPVMKRARLLYQVARKAEKGFTARMPGAMTDGVYVNDVVRIGDRPAMITVSPFTPNAEDLDMPQDPTLLLGIRFVTPAILEKLGSLSHVDGLSLADPAAIANGDGRPHPIRDASGSTVAHMTWTPSTPGTAIVRAALPAVTVSLILIALLTIGAAIAMRRLTRRLAESEQAALHASRHDAATGLANRGWFMSVFANLLASTGKRPTTSCVLLIDCDYFKSVNDTLGHAAGDAVLRAIGARLHGLGDGLAIAARLGGDEFALITAPIAASEALYSMRAIEDALSKPVTFGSHIIPVSVSVGAAVFDTPSLLSIDDLLAKADMALYRAKRDGRGRSRLYDPALDMVSALEAVHAEAQGRAPANDRTNTADANAAPGRAA